MRVKVISEIESTRGIIPAGQIIDISPAMVEKLNGKIAPLTDGREKSTYCHTGGCWCSSKLPAHMKPSACTCCTISGTKKEPYHEESKH